MLRQDKRVRCLKKKKKKKKKITKPQTYNCYCVFLLHLIRSSEAHTNKKNIKKEKKENKTSYLHGEEIPLIFVHADQCKHSDRLITVCMHGALPQPVNVDMSSNSGNQWEAHWGTMVRQ